jgi:hypothetical protein
VAFEQSLLNYLRNNRLHTQRTSSSSKTSVGSDQCDTNTTAQATATKVPNPTAVGSRLTVPILWLMGAYGLLQDLTQGLIKRLARVARKSSPDQWAYYFKSHRTPIVAVCLGVAVAFVWRNASKTLKKKNKNKDKDKKSK